MNSKIDRIIEIIRENMVANMPGTSGAYTSQGDSKIFAGFDKILDGRSKIMKRLPPPYRRKLQKNK